MWVFKPTLSRNGIFYYFPVLVSKKENDFIITCRPRPHGWSFCVEFVRSSCMCVGSLRILCLPLQPKNLIEEYVGWIRLIIMVLVSTVFVALWWTDGLSRLYTTLAGIGFYFCACSYYFTCNIKQTNCLDNSDMKTIFFNLSFHVVFFPRGDYWTCRKAFQKPR